MKYLLASLLLCGLLEAQLVHTGPTKTTGPVVVFGCGGLCGSRIDSTLTTPVQNLTTGGLGSLGWIHWGGTVAAAQCAPGNNGVETMSGGTNPSDFSMIGSGTQAATGNINFTWTNGTPDASQTNNARGCYQSAATAGAGFQFTALAELASHTLTVWTATNNNNSPHWSFTAHLSDSSSPDYVDTGIDSSGPEHYRRYTIIYHAGSNAQTLTITWKQTTTSTFIYLAGAALQ